MGRITVGESGRWSALAELMTTLSTQVNRAEILTALGAAARRDSSRPKVGLALGGGACAVRRPFGISFARSMGAHLIVAVPVSVRSGWAGRIQSLATT